MSDKISQLSIISNEAKYSTQKTVSDLIYSQAELHKDRIALVYEDRQITYGVLNARSNQLARRLREKGVRTNDLVGIFTEHSFETIISIYAVIKAGGAYIPINVNDSVKRQKHILKDSECRILLTNQKVDELIKNTKIDEVIQVCEKSVYTDNIDNLEVLNKSSDLLYLCYTSGSTGVPKGVMITHSNLVSLFDNDKFQFDFNSEDVWTLFHTYSFDFSAWEIYGCLLTGGKLVILTEETKKNVKDLLQTLEKEKITVLSLVPSVLYSLTDYSMNGTSLNLRYLILGGEALNPAKLKEWRNHYPLLTIVNLYGITETTIFDIGKIIEEEDISSGISNIGQPMPTHTVYILNGEEICQVGKSGEICISGGGIGKGYWKQEKLTQEKFIKNPFKKGDILYRTGDLARMLEDRNIEYLGRMDNQIKIRGYRIELEEIENCAKKYSSLNNIVVKPYNTKDTENTILVGYAAFKEESDQKRELDQLKRYLRKQLPVYMIPSYWIIMDKIPITVNGKADRKNLPEPTFEKERVNPEDIYPQNEIQIRLLRLWENLFHNNNIGIRDTFFELGGHSLLAIKLRNQISNEFNVDISMTEFMNDPTILGISLMLEKNTHKDMEVIEFQPNPESQYVPFEMTDLQQAYYIGRQSAVELGNCATHIYTEIRCKKYNHEKLLRILTRLIQRHDMLRCVFDDNGNQYVRKEIGEIKIPIKDISQYTQEKKQKYLSETRMKLENQILDYHKAPLLTLQTTLWDANEAILHLYHDAMIVDGWSHEILLSEADLLYSNENAKLPEINMTFRDYVQYYNSLKFTNKYEAARQFWMELIKTLPDNPELPLIKEPGNLTEISSIQIKRTFHMEEWKKVEEAADLMGVSTFVISLTAFCKAIARYSKKQSFIINVPVSYRPDMHRDVEKIVGVCSNYFLFDFYNSGIETFAQTAQRVQKRIWELNDNDVFTGTEVVRELYKKNGKIGEHIATIVFTSLIDVPYIERTNMKREFVETHTSQIWIDSVAFRMEDYVSFHWDCVKGLFDLKMLNHMADYFADSIKLVVKEKEAWFQKVNMPLPLEDRNIIEAINNTSLPMDNSTINDKLCNSFKQYSSNIAIAVADTTYTYRQLQEAAGKLSSLLLKAGVKEGDGVAILMKKDWRQIVAVISILSIGAYYMPLETDMPAANVDYCLKNTAIRIIITDKENLNKVVSNKEIIIINLEEEDFTLIQERMITYVKGSAKDLVSVIHTSGTTGRPKGIKLRQDGLINAIEFTNKTFRVCQTDKAIALTSLGHDMSMYDIFGMLFAGGTIVIPSDKDLKDPNHWIDLIHKYGVTIWNSVPSFMEMLLEAKRDVAGFCLQSLRLLIHGGDFLKPSVARYTREIAPNSELINVGGPTETTLWSIYHKVTKEDIDNKQIPYGRAIANMSHYILNDNLTLCPIGVRGTIFSAGIGVSAGYVNLVEENNKRFIEWDNLLLFNTGDIGYYLSNGEIQIVGRDDFQIKINGKRIEIEGIESILSDYKQIINCVVKLSPNGLYLIAYYASKIQYPKSELEEVILSQLPSYMLPKDFVRLEELPLTANKKIDRKALTYELEEGEVTEFELRDNLDIELEKYCCGLLGRNKVGLNENFFMGGGNSIATIKLLSFINKNYVINLKLGDLLKNPTIRAWHDLIVEEILKDEKLTDYLA